MTKKVKNKFIIIETDKIMPEKSKKIDEFYNYKNWREIQRNQLGISANLYFVFSSAIFGYTLNFLLADKGKNTLNCPAKIILYFSLIFILTSLLFYAIFTENRLKDFRKTAQLINEGKSSDEIKEMTKTIGINTWSNYNLQRYSLFIGFIISLVGFSIYLFN
jgi:hypothetical protein